MTLACKTSETFVGEDSAGIGSKQDGQLHAGLIAVVAGSAAVPVAAELVENFRPRAVEKCARCEAIPDSGPHGDFGFVASAVVLALHGINVAARVEGLPEIAL